MKRKLKIKHKQRMTKILHKSKQDVINFTKYLSLLSTCADYKMKKRIMNKSLEILCYDNYRPFIKNKIIVPVLYQTKTGKIKDLNMCKVFSSLEEMEQKRGTER